MSQEFLKHLFGLYYSLHLLHETKVYLYATNMYETLPGYCLMVLVLPQTSLMENSFFIP